MVVLAVLVAVAAEEAEEDKLNINIFLKAIQMSRLFYIEMTTFNLSTFGRKDVLSFVFKIIITPWDKCLRLSRSRICPRTSQ